MKKIVFVAFTLLGSAIYAQNANGFKVGTNIGLPIGDTSKQTSFNFGIDVYYTWKVIEKIDLGVTLGYTFYVEKNKNEGRDYSFLPIAISAQYNLNQQFYIATDLGYAIGSIEGGFYYQPKIGYSIGNNSLFLSFKGINGSSGLNSLLSDKERISLNSFNIGYVYRLSK